MPFDGFPERTLRFLVELSQHNEPKWFEAHRNEYESAVVQPAQELVLALGPRLRELDPKIQAVARVRGSIHAIERRRRFARGDQRPFRESLDLWFWSGRRRSWDNTGFFLRLTPSQLILAVGMVELQKETLARYRAHVLDDARGDALVAIVSELRANGYVVGGESYKRTPRGVPADHPRAALLKHSGLFATSNGDHPRELGTAEFLDFAFAHFRNMAALHGWLLTLLHER
jgi:uncharacterized protein (TIGR02453 family)